MGFNSGFKGLIYSCYHCRARVIRGLIQYTCA